MEISILELYYKYIFLRGITGFEALPCGFLSLSLMAIPLSQNFGLLCPKRHLTFSMADCRALFPLRCCEFHFPILFP